MRQRTTINIFCESSCAGEIPESGNYSLSIDFLKFIFSSSKVCRTCDVPDDQLPVKIFSQPMLFENRLILLTHI